MINPGIVFMGTPDFAVASLERLIAGGCNVIAVVTAPDKPAGRGMQVTQSAVKKFAVEHGIKVLQPEKLKSEQFLDELRNLDAGLQVVVAFRMLPEVVWNMPPLGTINLHGSLLPQYRGAAPINWAIINGEKQTGVTTFKLKHEIDTGDILLSEKIAIGENETAGELHDRMKVIGADLILRTVIEMGKGTIRKMPQHVEGGTNTEIHHAPKIFTETALIRWDKPVYEIHNLIRGLSPYPGAHTFLAGKTLKIYRANKELSDPVIKSGEFQTDHKTYLKFAATNGFINVLQLQLEGKKKMEIDQFLRGYRF